MSNFRLRFFAALWVFLLPPAAWVLWSALGPWSLLVLLAGFSLLGAAFIPGSSPIDLLLDLSVALLLAFLLFVILFIANYVFVEQIGEWYSALGVLAWITAFPLSLRMLRSGTAENYLGKTGPARPVASLISKTNLQWPPG